MRKHDCHNEKSPAPTQTEARQAREEKTPTMGISPAAASMPAASLRRTAPKCPRSLTVGLLEVGQRLVARRAILELALEVDDDSGDDLVGPRRRDLVGRRALG